MFAQIEHPQNLSPEALDTFLANGWFRMRQTIFTTNFLHFNQQFYSAIWLRVSLERPILDARYHRLKKLNKAFKIAIKKSRDNGVSPRHEMLYQFYRQSISFEVSPTLRELLYGNESHNRFNTHEVNIYDGDALIATGFFDLGKTSAAGITCIYHPEYKKYSLGKYLMYLKMEYCQQQQVQYFYPGYMVPGYASFDYKMEIGKDSLEFLQLTSQQWLPYAANTILPCPLQQMLEKLVVLQNILQQQGIAHSLLYYKFFEANLDPYYYSNDLFDFPVFIRIATTVDETVFAIVVFDVRDDLYSIVRCSSVINTGFQQGARPIFDADLLRVDKRLFSSTSAEEVAGFLGTFS